MLYGHREFVCLIGSDEGHAMDMLESPTLPLGGVQENVHAVPRRRATIDG